MDRTNVPTDELVLCKNLELWMTRLPVSLKALPIIHLAIPGSHDSMTYTIHRSNDVGPDESSVVQLLGKCLGLITKSIIFNWSITQYDNVKEQLNGGIRYFDLRLAAKSNNIDTYFVHGLYGSEITKPLKELDEWLRDHPNEIVILDFQHFYSFTDAHHKNVVAQLKQMFQNKICPHYNKLENISISWMNSMKYQLIIVYRNIIAKIDTLLWPSGLWPTPWPDTVNTEQLLSFLNTQLHKRVRDMGFVSQCLLTPDKSYVLRHLFSNLHATLGIKCQKVILDWVEKNQPGPGGLNIIIADYISNHDFVFPKTVIQRNTLLLREQFQNNQWEFKS